MEKDEVKNNDFYVVKNNIPNFVKHQIISLEEQGGKVLKDYPHLIGKIVHDNVIILEINDIEYNEFMQSCVKLKTINSYELIQTIKIKRGKTEKTFSIGDELMISIGADYKFAKISAFDLETGWVHLESGIRMTTYPLQTLIGFSKKKNELTINEDGLVYCFNKFGTGVVKLISEINHEDYEIVVSVGAEISENSFILNNKCLSINDVAEIYISAKTQFSKGNVDNKAKTLFKMVEKIIEENSKK